MRKGQQKIIDQAKKNELSDEYIEFLTNENISLTKLDIIYRYFLLCSKNPKMNIRDVIKETERCLLFCHDKITETEFNWRLGFLLPRYNEDYLYKKEGKKKLAEMESMDTDRWILNFKFMKYDIPSEATNIVFQYYDSTPPWTGLSYVVHEKKVLLDLKENLGNSFLGYCFQYKKTFSIESWIEIQDLIGNDLSILREIGYENIWDNDAKDLNTVLIKKHIEYKNFIFCVLDQKYGILSNNYFCLIPGDERAFKILKEVSLQTNTVITAKLYSKSIFIYKNNMFINILIKSANSITYHPSGYCNLTEPNNTLVSFYITPDYRFFEKKNGKSYPLSLKHLFGRNIKFDQEILYVIFTALGDNSTYLFHDIYEDCKYGSVLPIKINDIFQFRNKKQMMQGLYKKASGIKIKWNKININLAYLILKSVDYAASGKSMEILLQVRNEKILFKVLEEKNKKVKDNIISFLAYVIVSRINSSSDKYDSVSTGMLEDEEKEEIQEILLLAKDYVKMCMLSKRKVALTISSERELANKHNSYQKKDYDSITQEVKVPKDSKFNGLRKILPEDFEWITSRKRLIIEAQLQHHCVWSYADKISRDECAIYSYVDYTGQYAHDGVPRRYTIEFACKNGNYEVVQTQGKYDKVNASKIAEVVRLYLEGKKM